MTEPFDMAARLRAIAAAQGKEPFDLLLAGGRVLDVATLELREADVGIVGAMIASVHPRGKPHGGARDPRRERPDRRAGLHRRPCAFRILAHAAASLRRRGGAAGHDHDLLRPARARQRARHRGRALYGRGDPRAAAALHRAGLVLRTGGARARSFRRRFSGRGNSRTAVLAGDRRPRRSHGHARRDRGASAHGRDPQRGAGIGQDHRRPRPRPHRPEPCRPTWRPASRPITRSPPAPTHSRSCAPASRSRSAGRIDLSAPRRGRCHQHVAGGSDQPDGVHRRCVSRRPGRKRRRR